MVGFFFLVFFCAHYTMHSWHQAWPAMPESKMDVIPTWAWAKALANKSHADNECKLGATPNPTDMYKSLSIKRFAFLPNAIQLQGGAGVRSGFPENFGQGIGISASPPPLDDEERRAAWNVRFNPEGGDVNAAIELATDQLRARLLEYGRPLLQVDGIYEGCGEHSFIMDVPQGTGKIPQGVEAHKAIGEMLREAFHQQSYLFFGPRQYVDDGTAHLHCGRNNFPELEPVAPGEPLANWFRTAGLGFGPENEDPENVVQVGNLCEFTEPQDPYQYPFACSMGVDPADGMYKMWAGTNKANYQHWLYNDC